MINFVSIDTIVNDLLTIIRGGRITQSEPISKLQIEYWVHQYRALLIKQDLDKGKMPNPDYIQEIPAIKLVRVDRTDSSSSIVSGDHVYATEIELPKTIDLNFKPGIVSVSTIDGTEIQLVPQGRSQLQKYKKYTNRDIIAYLKNQKIYVECPTALSYISVRGIFEVPTEVNLLVNSLITNPVYSPDNKYPVPINMLPTLKEMILKKELNIIVASNVDDKNDSTLKLEPTAQKDV